MDSPEYEELATLHARILFLREQAIQTSSSPVVEPEPRKVRVTLPGVLLVLSLAGVIASAVAAQVFPSYAIVLLLQVFFLVLAIVTGLWTIVAVIRKRRLRLQPITAPADVSAADNTELRQHEAELATRLALVGCTDWDDLERKYETADIARHDRDLAQSQLDVLVPDGVSTTELLEARRDFSRQRRDAEEQLQVPGLAHAADMDTVAYNRLVQEIDNFERDKSQLQKELSKLEYAASTLEVDLEDLNTTEERLAAVNSEVERLKELLEVYELSLATMQAARNTTLVRASDLLAPRIGVLLNHLTDGRYERVTVDSELNIAVYTPDGPDTPVDPARLSKGTQDQLYFAARIALCDLLFEDTRVPLFLDDPFVTFDVDRRQAAIEICQQIAQERQVFLFTCSDDYDAFGNVIRMVRS